MLIIDLRKFAIKNYWKFEKVDNRPSVSVSTAEFDNVKKWLSIKSSWLFSLIKKIPIIIRKIMKYFFNYHQNFLITFYLSQQDTARNR